MNSTPTPQRDIRYQCLMTSLAILFFINEWYYHSLLLKSMDLASDLDLELPLITSAVARFPLLTLIFLFGTMLSTIVFSWIKRFGNIGVVMASISLLFQGIILMVINIASKLPWMQLMQSLSE